MMKSVLVISPTDLKRDPRVYRQLNFLIKKYKVTALGVGSPDIDEVEYLNIKVAPKNIKGKFHSLLNIIFRNFEKFYWSSSFVTQSLLATNNRYFDVIIANDVISLPLALKIGNKKSRIILDAHEYSPGEHSESFVWRLLWAEYFNHICKVYLKNVDGMMTVCQGIAREYVKTYNISPPQIVYNAPPFQHLNPTTTQNRLIRLVHHGASLKGRRLESLIEMMAYLDDRYTLDFFLMPDGNGYLQQLKSLAKADVRIKFNDPVAMQDLPKVCNQYDVGVYTLPPSNFNNLNALPNKIFEFIQARLALAIGPSPEMSQIVRDYSCGVVAKDYSAKALAEALLTLNQGNIANYKKNSGLAAKVLCAENSSETILNLIQ